MFLEREIAGPWTPDLQHLDIIAAEAMAKLRAGMRIAFARARIWARNMMPGQSFRMRAGEALP